MNEQLELIDCSKKQDTDEVQRLIDLLLAAGNWLTADQIREQIGWSDRKVRALASASKGQIVSTNSGYKHTKHITPEEFSEFWNRMVNQGKKMIGRAILVKQVHHGYIG